MAERKSQKDSNRGNKGKGKFKSVDFTNLEQVAKLLDEHNKWRRGIGKYRWHENPSKNVDSPCTTAELTQALEVAVKTLKSIGGNTCDCKNCAFKGMSICEHREYLDKITKLRTALAITNQLLGDLAGILYDYNLHNEEEAVLEAIESNSGILKAKEKKVPKRRAE